MIPYFSETVRLTPFHHDTHFQQDVFNSEEDSRMIGKYEMKIPNLRTHILQHKNDFQCKTTIFVQREEKTYFLSNHTCANCNLTTSEY